MDVGHSNSAGWKMWKNYGPGNCDNIFDPYNCDLEPGCSYNYTTGYCENNSGQPNTTSVTSTNCYNIFDEVNCNNQPGCKYITDPGGGYCEYDTSINSTDCSNFDSYNCDSEPGCNYNFGNGKCETECSYFDINDCNLKSECNSLSTGSTWK